MRRVILSAAKDLLFVATATMLMFGAASDADAQRRGRGFYGGNPNDFWEHPEFRGNAPYDGRVTFARIKYRGYQKFQGDGVGWAHDYPRAEEHLMRIIREITAIRPFVESDKVIGGNVIALDDPDLMKYPVAYLSEPGGWFPNEKEIAGLRSYLLKGGFVIVDDFADVDNDFQHFLEVMKQVLPKGVIGDVPESHAIFDAFYKVDLRLMESGGQNYGGRARYLAYHQDNDPKKRIMMMVNLNLDVGESWQWSPRGFNIAPTNEAYKLGVNYLVYALTH